MVMSTDERQPAGKNKMRTVYRMLVFAAAISLSLTGGLSCGAQVRGHGSGVAKLIKRAWNNGAYKCAPKDLTLAEAHLRFARDRLKQGQYFNAKEHMALADHHARAAIKKSPKDRCAPRKVVEAPPRPRPVKVEVKVVDTDGDGIPDQLDKCPKEPEDFDGFEDEDGCPEPDNDGDGICDDNETIQNRLTDFADICKGKDKCTGKDIDKITDFVRTKEDLDGFEDEDGCPDADNDGDGICDDNGTVQGNLEYWKSKSVCKGKDGCPGKEADKANKFVETKEDLDGFEDEDGCPDPDNDGDEICDDNSIIQKHIDHWKSKDKCKGEDKCAGKDPDKKNDFADTRGGKFNPSSKRDDGCPRKLKLIVVTKRRIELKQKVYFDFDKATIKKVSYPLLNEVAEVLKDRPTMHVRIEGHTDSRGSRRYNRRLSNRRARSVRQYMIDQGVSGRRMVAKGYGQSKPIATNRTKEGRDKNRRVEFHITKR